MRENVCETVDTRKEKKTFSNSLAVRKNKWAWYSPTRLTEKLFFLIQKVCIDQKVNIGNYNEHLNRKQYRNRRAEKIGYADKRID